VKLEHRIDTTSHASSVVSQSHGGTADDEYICNDSPARQALPQRRKGLLDLGPTEKNVARLGTQPPGP
jgi:hypothetical protein